MRKIVFIVGVFVAGVLPNALCYRAIAAPAKANPFVGVWHYHFWTPGSGHSPRWIILFDNGEAFEDLPVGGLLHFSRQASQKNPREANYWGAYVVKGKQCVIKRPGVKNPRTLTLTKENEIRLDTGEYAYPAPVVDGLKLDGSWTTSSDQRLEFIHSFPEGQRPLITFRKDGTFTDHGQFVNEILWFSPRQAGKGRYTITKYTLALNYDDQPDIELAFSLPGSKKTAPPVSAPGIFYLDRRTLHKVTK